jgi:ribosomal protein S18 acetylase RimI-like enzyme
MIEIRKAISKDVPEIMRLVKELAAFENAPEEVINTEERMLFEGFSNNPSFGCYLAHENDKILGMALYYYRYSTWKGKRLYLEDLIVTKEARGNGIGKLLFDKIIEHAKESQCSGMMWQVLDWNETAINFYNKYETKYDKGWLNCHLNF